MVRLRILATFLALAGFATAVSLRAAAKEAQAEEASQNIALFAPAPEYPYQAKEKSLAGAGIALLEIDRATGNVTRVHMEESTGQAILDREAITTFGKWRFKPGTIAQARVPIDFTMGGVRTYSTYEFKERPMDYVLARYLGKGTVLKGPMPTYPSFHPWTFKEGRGVYELHVDGAGRVNDVKILKSSGDETFDKITSKTLRKWVLRRGPLVVELPLSFKLRPDKYSVAVAR